MDERLVTIPVTVLVRAVDDRHAVELAQRSIHVYRRVLFSYKERGLL